MESGHEAVGPFLHIYPAHDACRFSDPTNSTEARRATERPRIYADSYDYLPPIKRFIGGLIDNDFAADVNI